MKNNITIFHEKKILINIITIFLVIIGILLLIKLFLPRGFNKSPVTIQSDIEDKQKGTITVIQPRQSKVFTNATTAWQSISITNSKINVVSDLKLSMDVTVSFEEDAPFNSNAGVNFSNGLKENDANIRKIGIYYSYETQQWHFDYQSGTTIKYNTILFMPEKIKKSNFSILIASNGKSILVVLPNKSTRTFLFSHSLYEVTNDMTVSTITGPKSQLSILSLGYQIFSQ